MFRKARLKLTAWYLLIIMLISIAFSIAIYEVSVTELSRVERVQRMRRELQIPLQQRRPVIDQEVLQESQERLRAILVLINLTILGTSGIAGYFLAGRTLKPIREMIDEQNRFITDASHELRTPLTSLKSEIEVNLRDKNLSLNNAKKLLMSNLEEVNSLQYLSDNLIKLTQYKQGNNVSFEETSLLEIVSEALKKVAIQSKQKNVTIKNNIKDINLRADKQRLTEAFVIFLDNAIKYSSKGKTITIVSQKVDNSIEIKIIDQGIGIKEEEIPYLFERFYRGDNSRAKIDVSGFGLGLAIARQIIDQHHGSISVESKLGKGSTFIIKLPVI